MKTAHFQRKPITSSQDLSVAALSKVTAIGRQFKLEEVTIHTSIPITETVTITRDSATATEYDTVLASRSMVAESDFVFRPQGECNFLSGDELLVECTDANSVGTVYLEIKTSEM